MTVIAIDGPAGSGKSTIAAAVAVKLGIPHVDTGAYYRAATLAVLQAGVDPADGAASATAVRDARIERRGGRTWLEGHDVEEEIRGQAVTAAVSAVSAHPAVRAALVQRQRETIGPAGAVVEGRDAGTVVVPDADVKIWLTATPDERSRRRAAQLDETGADAVAAHAAAIAARDRHDAAQMVPAPDAVEINSSGLAVREVVEAVLGLVAAHEERGGT